MKIFFQSSNGCPGQYDRPCRATAKVHNVSEHPVFLEREGLSC